MYKKVLLLLVALALLFTATLGTSCITYAKTGDFVTIKVPFTITEDDESRAKDDPMRVILRLFHRDGLGIGYTVKSFAIYTDDESKLIAEATSANQKLWCDALNGEEMYTAEGLITVAPEKDKANAVFTRDEIPVSTGAGDYIFAITLRLDSLPEGVTDDIPLFTTNIWVLDGTGDIQINPPDIITKPMLEAAEATSEPTSEATPGNTQTQGPVDNTDHDTGSIPKTQDYNILIFIVLGLASISGVFFMLNKKVSDK